VTAVEGKTRRRRGRPDRGTREALIQATLDVIADDESRLTTAEVARRAGVAEGSVFYHFGDRLGLLQEVIYAGLGRLTEVDFEKARDPGRPLAEGLTEMAVALESFFARALPVLGAIETDPELREDLVPRLIKENRGPHRGVEQFRRYLELARDSGRVDASVDLDGIAQLLVGACLLHAWNAYLWKARGPSKLPPLRRSVEAVAALLAPHSGS